ncbi:MAG: formate dehydrogenase accessory sulfurtransferase FdhD [Nitrospirales bacterium]|nr:formate dehydrogenase accessory sulfurtransferase FdhD [Nitrospirales bacterium]
MEGTVKRSIHRSLRDSFEERVDPIAIEKRLVISVNGQEVLSLYCTPLMVRELVIGMMMTEEIIKGGWCTEEISIREAEDIFVNIPAEGGASTEGAVITSGCIGGITFAKREFLRQVDDPFRIAAEDLKALFRRFQDASDLYKVTGCVHSAGLSDGRDILCLAEDIGRHNAVDKVIGYALSEGIPFEGKIMLASGRLSSEIVSKCARWGIPIVASRTSPTSLSVEIAERQGITLVGFIRAERMNIYTHPERII